jgi:hypothetical protein
MPIASLKITPAPAPELIPEITNHPWHITRKYGFGVNLEQNLTPNLTAFARFGWDNGKTESFAYTEVDQTFAEGLGANGAWWHRKQDRAGIAFVSNAIKKDHQNYLADGGLGFLLGDGGLTLRPRKYSWKLITQSTCGAASTSPRACSTSTIPATTATAAPS